MRILIGCPVRAREWIIDRWFEHAVIAGRNHDLAFVFVAPNGDPTVQKIFDCSERLHVNTDLVLLEEDLGPDVRRWTSDRYSKMVYLRNRLLGFARQVRPDLLLSLDSDMLIHEMAVDNMIESLANNPDWAAVGGKAYLTERGINHPTFGMFKRGSTEGAFRRHDANSVMQVDALMAIKLMTPDAYNVDYEFSRYGEDLGWSMAVKRAGLKVGWDGRVTSKHVMRPELLEGVDPRCGF